MFKQLTQIGKNLTDELAKGLNEELNGINPDQLDKTGPYADLPSDVQVKLRKFDKYEQKYPLLLQAYKNEKLKTEKVEQFQKVLSECTPVSDISDVDSLKSYFSTVNQKTDMLNNEVKRLTLENTQLSQELEKVDTHELEQVKGELDKSTTSVENLEKEVVSLKQEISTKDQLIDSFKNKIEELTSTPSSVDSSNATSAQETTENTASSTAQPTASGKKKNQKKKKGKANNNNNLQNNNANAGAAETAAAAPATEPNQKAKDITEAITLRVKLDTLQADYDKLNKEYELLTSTKADLAKLKETIKIKDEELESVRDMLKDVGNDLVAAQDQLKSKNDASAEVNNLKLQLESLRSNNADNLKSYELKQNELNNEIASLKKNESSLRQTVTQKEKIIDYLENQVKEYSSKESEYKNEIELQKKENSAFVKRIENLNKETAKWKNESQKNNGNLESYIKENGKLSERLEVLQEKLETLQNLKSNSNDQVETIRKQCEELSFKLKDANKKILSLEDELNENANILQERNRETTTMRKMLNELQTDKSNRVKELESRLHFAVEEKSKIENELQMELTRKSQDLKQLKQKNTQLQSVNHDQLIKIEQYSAEIEELKSTFERMKRSNNVSQEDTSELDSIVKSLKEALVKSEKKQREIMNTNVELKELNNDLNKKFDRLSKNYKNLSLQISKTKDLEPKSARSSPHPSRSGSIVQDTISSPISSTQSEINEKIAYIKNVLLGFLEHRDQRDQLLPVVTTLLQLDSNDEKRLLLSLK